MVRLVRNFFYMVSLILFCLSAREAEANKQEEAKKNYKAAIELSEAEEFEAALPYFKKAYEISGKRPVTILGLAQCERALKMYDEAIKHFEEYLATNPPKERAEVVRSTVRLTHKLRDDQAKKSKSKPLPKAKASTSPKLVEDSTTTTSMESEADGNVLSKPWFWIVTGVVVVGGGVAAALALGGSEPERPATGDPADGGSTGVLIRP